MAWDEDVKRGAAFALTLCGAGAIVAGVGAISLPAALIVGGLATMAFGLLVVNW